VVPPELDDDVRLAIEASNLRGLPPEVIEVLVAGARRVHIPARSTERPVAGRSPHLDLVLSGLVRVQVSEPDGRALTVRYCREGDLLGAATLYAEVVRPFTIQALRDAEVLSFAAAQVRALADQDARLARALLAETSERVMSFLAGLSGHAFGSVRQRIARHLLDLVADADPDGLMVRISQQELADAVGSVREVVVRVLRELRGEGAIVTGRTGIVITDPERLSTITRMER
jgi:CRP/FNR family transcriptional regulator